MKQRLQTWTFAATNLKQTFFKLPQVDKFKHFSFEVLHSNSQNASSLIRYYLLKARYDTVLF